MSSLSPQLFEHQQATTTDCPNHVVIVGGGFGGLETAKRLRKASVKVTLIDRHNYHLFQPLLYQVATGGLSPANIATPLRSIVRRQANCTVLMAEVTDFDIAGKRLILQDGDLAYDYLVVAAGATHSYFGNDQWESVAPGLKSIGDAAEIRRRVYGAFEAAERTTDPDLRVALLTFVVVGGGPTGVELAGALSEIARHTLKRDFRQIRPEDSRIILVEASPHVLSHYPDSLCNRAKKDIEDLGIEVRTQTKVVEITEDFVRLSSPRPATDGLATNATSTDVADQEEIIQTRTVLWGAGVQASPLAKRLADPIGVKLDRGGRIPVTQNLSIDGHDNVFVIGDMAISRDQDGKPYPGLASVAIQQGDYVAKRIRGLVKDAGREGKATDAKPFHYKDFGTMATIGRAKAVAEIGNRHFTGSFAWLLWLFVHLMLIVQFQNRVLILFQWAWNYITFNRSNRLILGESNFVAEHLKAADLTQKSA